MTEPYDLTHLERDAQTLARAMRDVLEQMPLVPRRVLAVVLMTFASVAAHEAGISREHFVERAGKAWDVVVDLVDAVKN